MMVLGFILFLVLIARIAHWTIFRQPYYKELARNNFIHPQRLGAPRGAIYSRDGKPLAVNRRTYSIWISPFRVSRRELHETVVFLENILGRDFSEKEREALDLRPRWRRKLLARNLSLETVTPILERRWSLDGLRITTDFKRYYPGGEVCGHVMGYLGRLSPQNLSAYLEKGYARDDLVGVAGIEHEYEDLLRGSPGREIVQRDARGRFCKTLRTQTALPGNDLHLTIDLDFQRFATYKLGQQRGVILVMNPLSGKMYVMVSYPSYDSNDPAAVSKPSRPVSYLNKAIQENYPPASTFKLVTAVAGFQAGVNNEKKFLCEGDYYLPNWKRPYKCDMRSGHGWLNLEDALKYSCNIFFYQSARRIGAPALLQWAIRFGYGTRTGIDLPYEIAGILPVQSADSMLPGNLLYLSIGQGQISATPLQVLLSYAIFANGGKRITPHLLDYYKGADHDRHYNMNETDQISLAAWQRQVVLNGLVKVVNSRGGTASRVDFPKSWKVAGKTGTAERSGREDDAWFVCFAPYDAPEVAVLVFLEEGGFGGSIAAPVAREIMDYYFLNRSRFVQ